MTLTRPLPVPAVHPGPPPGRLRPVLGRSPAAPSEAPERDGLLGKAHQLQERARLCAMAGDLAGAAQLILQALDHERRAGGLGPQVLQLIKPR